MLHKRVVIKLSISRVNGKYKITLKALDEKLRLIHINPATLTENSISKSVRILAPHFWYGYPS